LPESLDEAIALPTDFSAKIARDTQKYLQQETGITNVVDPWGGSYYVEKLTADLADRARELMKEIEDLGGMAKAIEQGLPKLRIEEAAARKQARIDGGTDKIIGVNLFPNLDEEENIDVLEVDNKVVRESQVSRLESIKGVRDAGAVAGALAGLRQCAATGEGNLLEKAVVAARARATLGEISDALETSFGPPTASSLVPTPTKCSRTTTFRPLASLPENSPKRTAGSPASWWPSLARTATTVELK